MAFSAVWAQYLNIRAASLYNLGNAYVPVQASPPLKNPPNRSAKFTG